MFFRILLVGVLIGGILMALSFISGRTSSPKTTPKETGSSVEIGTSRGVFWASVLAIFKFFWYLILLAAASTLAYFVFKFLGLL